MLKQQYKEYQVVPTIDVGLGALTGSPLALTGARVPALSAFLCSRWICMCALVSKPWYTRANRARHVLCPSWKWASWVEFLRDWTDVVGVSR